MSAADRLAACVRYFQSKHVCHCAGCGAMRQEAQDALIAFADEKARQGRYEAAIQDMLSIDLTKVRHAGL